MSLSNGDMEIDPGNVPDELLTSGPTVALQTSQQEDLFNIPQELASYQPPPQREQRETIRELCVKVHIRRSGKDTWSYLGRAFVSQEVIGHSSRVVVRSAASNKIMVTFSENSDLQAERRGNFVVISCVEGPNVISWSLNTMNNSETIKLLTSIEIACHRCRQTLADPKQHNKIRRRVERIIKEDRKRRHRRRRDEDAMVEAFEKQQIN